MKILLPTILLIFSWTFLAGQTLPETREGKVSYVTTQDIYVKFQSTENIVSGDTLFMTTNGVRVPAAIVRDISSISCVCIPFAGIKLSVGDQLFSNKTGVTPQTPVIAAGETARAVPVAEDSVEPKKTETKAVKQIVSGNLTLASYSNFSNITANSQRMRYTFALSIQNIGNTKLSAETYITFAHKLDNWSEIQNDLFNGQLSSLCANVM